MLEARMHPGIHPPAQVLRIQVELKHTLLIHTRIYRLYIDREQPVLSGSGGEKPKMCLYLQKR